MMGKIGTQLFMRGFFGIVSLAASLVGSSLILPLNESRRLDNEIKDRAFSTAG